MPGTSASANVVASSFTDTAVPGAPATSTHCPRSTKRRLHSIFSTTSAASAIPTRYHVDAESAMSAANVDIPAKRASPCGLAVLPLWITAGLPIRLPPHPPSDPNTRAHYCPFYARLLNDGLLRSSHQLFGAPTFITYKSDVKARLICDFRDYNGMFRNPPTFSLPPLEDILPQKTRRSAILCEIGHLALLLVYSIATTD